MEVVKIKAGNSRVFVGSDAHYWPGKPSTAHRAFCQMIRDQMPNVVVLNGDMFDFPSISSHPPIGWEKFPTVKQEIKVVQARLGEIAEAARKSNPKVRLVWALGNHDARFNKALASKVPAFKNLPGTKLSDYFPDWEPCWRVDIGDVVIKHELKGGSNPLKSNAIAAGKSVVTGHHHSQNVLAYTDYNGTRYAVDAGCLCKTSGPQFEYGEANPTNWRSGFAVLQFLNGKVLPPMLATVLDEKRGHVHFNGYIYGY